MADAVIKLLEILYNAELLRIYMCNDRFQQCANQAKQYNSQQIENQQQQFADKASDSLSAANHLGQFLQIRAQGEELPVLKQEMEQASAQLIDLANQILNQANNCMDEPENQQAIQTFRNLNEQAQQIARTIVQKIKDAEAFKTQKPAPAAPAPVQAQAPRPVSNANPAMRNANLPSNSPGGNRPAQSQSQARPQNPPAQNRPAQPRQTRAPAAPAAPKANNLQDVVNDAKSLAQQSEVLNRDILLDFSHF
jgi:hypothetical protein